MRTTLFAAAALSLITATGGFAAGSGSETPPKPTETTKVCKKGKIYDTARKRCVRADRQSFNDDTRYDAVRELAYAGAYDRAEMIIASADNPADARFLNYKGFIQRKQGNFDQAMFFYTAALEKSPDYHLARSYMGQGLIAQGDIQGAKAQLAEIRARGGRDTWAYVALKSAIGGTPSNY